MIPRVARSGHSFQGAGLYYLNDKREPTDRSLVDEANRAFADAGDYALHDKGGAKTAYRVGFTAILNMEAKNPDQAISQMTASFDRYREKEAHKRGRKLTKPVYVYSLSWAPDQAPSQNDMMDAARSSLKALRLEGLQTLIVQHIDEPHPHIHILVNRIEQDGSRARNIAFDQLRFSRWAEEYERENGGIRCEQRVLNNELRRQGVMTRDTVSLTRSEYTARERAQRAALPQWQRDQEAFRQQKHQAERKVLWVKQVQERAQLEQKTKARVSAEVLVVDKQFKPKWRALYAVQKTERDKLARANKGGIFERAVFVFTNKKLLANAGPLRLRDIASLSLSAKKLSRRVARAHQIQRTGLAQWKSSLTEGAQRIAWREHAQTFAALDRRHQLERDLLVQGHRNEHENAQRQQPPLSRAPEPPNRRAPELRPEQAIAPAQIKAVISDSSLERTFAKVAQEDRERERSKTRERVRRRDRDRDRGPYGR